MNIEEIKTELEKEFVTEIVDGIEDVLALIKSTKSEDTNKSLLKDVIETSTNGDQIHLIYQSVFALMDIGAIEVDFMDIKRFEVMPFDLVGESLFDDSESLDYVTLAGENVSVLKSDTDLCITL